MAVQGERVGGSGGVFVGQVVLLGGQAAGDGVLDEGGELGDDPGHQVRVLSPAGVGHHRLHHGFNGLDNLLDHWGLSGGGLAHGSGADLDEVGLLGPLLPVALIVSNVAAKKEFTK